MLWKAFHFERWLKVQALSQTLISVLPSKCCSEHYFSLTGFQSSCCIGLIVPADRVLKREIMSFIAPTDIARKIKFFEAYRQVDKQTLSRKSYLNVLNTFF